MDTTRLRILLALVALVGGLVVQDAAPAEAQGDGTLANITLTGTITSGSSTRNSINPRGRIESSIEVPYVCMRAVPGASFQYQNVNMTVEGFCIRAGVSTSTAQYFEDAHDEGQDYIGDYTVYSHSNTRSIQLTLATGTTTADSQRLNVPFRGSLQLRAANASGTLLTLYTVSSWPAGAVSARNGPAYGHSEDYAQVTVTSGAACSFSCRSTMTSRASGGAGEVVLSFSAPADSGIPSTPEAVEVTRSADYTVATISWEIYESVAAYEINRLAAVVVETGTSARIEYGDPVTYRFDNSWAGLNEYEDATVAATTTYQYRIRARGSGTTDWSEWSGYVFSGAQAEAADLAAPSNVALSHSGAEVTVSWTAPAGTLEHYTVQRQELAVVEGSTFFANVRTFGNPWLPGASTMYRDRSILPDRTYEYRVAAVNEDLTGEYTEWSRVTPASTSLGPAPADWRFLFDQDRILDDRREFWHAWSEVAGADDYEVQTVTHNPSTGGQRLETLVVTEPTVFRTIYSRVDVRVRGRKRDAALCGSGVQDRCVTDWTAWWGTRFTPTAPIAAPPMAMDDGTGDPQIVELRADTEALIEEMLEPSGAVVEGALVVQFLSVLVALIAAGTCMVLSWRRGMAPLGAGMATAIFVLILFTSYRLYGIPGAWPLAAQALIGVSGLYAMVRQAGVFR